jgi:hypothetical protein
MFWMLNLQILLLGLDERRTSFNKSHKPDLQSGDECDELHVDMDIIDDIC